MNINKKQMQVIHIAKNQLKLDDDLYREILQQKFKVKSSKDLTYRQAENLIYYFRQKGFKINKKPAIKQGDKIIKLASKYQFKLIDILKRNILWQVSYEAWLNKRMKIKKVLTSREASKVIEGLKGMLGIKTKHIEFRALPFPYNDLNKFKDSWVYDLNKNKLLFIDDGSIVKILE